MEICENIDQFDLDQERQDYLKGKIVIVGSTMAEEQDIHQVPITNVDGTNTMNGVEIHATAIQNVLRGDYVQRANPNLELALIIFLGIVSFFAILHVRLLKVRHVALLEVASLVIVALLLFAVFEIGVLSFINNSALINIVYPGLAVVIAYLGAAVYQYLAERQQKALIKNVFSKYISAAVVNELLAHRRRPHVSHHDLLLAAVATRAGDALPPPHRNLHVPLRPRYGVTVVDKTNHVEFRWDDHDSYTVPSWRWHSHKNLSQTEPAILFSFTDRPLLEMTGLDREEKD